MKHPEHYLCAMVTKALRQNWLIRKYSYSTRPRPDNGFLLLLKGTMEYRTEGKTILLKPGNLIFLPIGSKYEVKIRTEEHPVEDLLINFDLPLGDTPLPKTPTVLLEHCPEKITAVAERMVKEYDEGSTLLIQSDFYLLCHQIRTIKSGADKDNETIRTAKHLLSSDKTLPMDEIAARLLISPSGLRKKFKDATGISPTEFRIRKKIERAKTLLQATDLPVETVAAQCNFYDTAYFCKIFKKYTALTPNEYRESGELYL